jgi:hypothetical protein
VSNQVFVVGSGRSGTTLIGDILDLHPQICRWYEPYFIMDHHFRHALNDCRTAMEANDEVKQQIINAFEGYRRRRGCQIIVDKSPRNSLKIPFLLAIFPKAKFIHVLRDGRDATLSIYREWQKRQHILREKKNFFQAMQAIQKFLARQPLLEHKVAALCFEIADWPDILKGKQAFPRFKRWEGQVGWGPRFEGWQVVIARVSTLEFSALQWAKCVDAIIAASHHFEADRFLEIRYEALLRQPEETLKQIFDFLEAPFPPGFMQNLPLLSADNFGKWAEGFSSEEKARLGPILQPLLNQLGYAKDDRWYKPAGQGVREELCADESF